MSESIHKTVLLHESIDGLALKKGDVFLDCTINGGGHSELVAKSFGHDVRLIGIDLDEDALDKSKVRLEATGANFSLHQANFRTLDKVLADAKVEKVQGILFDLGWSSDQFENGGRGFSFQKNESLIMTFSKTRKVEVGNMTSAIPYQLTAFEIVNEWEEQNIADIIFGYGEERYARRIAKGIIDARAVKAIETSGELVEIIRKAVPSSYRNSKLNCATRTFQALRIAVNDELGALREGLEKAFYSLSSPGPNAPNEREGRMGVISFHSLEDRIVKRFFKEKEKESRAEIITKKPLVAGDEEMMENRRSRSAKLRILKKIAI